MTEPNRPKPVPLPLRDALVPMVKGAAIIAAVQLGLFKAIGGISMSIQEIVDAIHSSLSATSILVEELTNVGYLVRQMTEGGVKYTNGPIPNAWLTNESSIDHSAAILLLSETWRHLGGLEEIVRSGPRLSLPERYSDPSVLKLYIRHMKNLALLGADRIAKNIPIDHGAKDLLDIGGSHGLYSIAICKQNPEVKATVFDLPDSLSETAGNVSREGLTGRVGVLAGDFFKDPLGGPYDVILLFQILHGQSPEEDIRILDKVSKALKSKGQLIILGFDKKDPPGDWATAFSMNVLIHGGRVYSYDEIVQWLKETGFSEFSRIELPPESLLIVARKE